jgi:hypothetical protein
MELSIHKNGQSSTDQPKIPIDHLFVEVGGEVAGLCEYTLVFMKRNPGEKDAYRADHPSGRSRPWGTGRGRSGRTVIEPLDAIELDSQVGVEITCLQGRKSSPLAVVHL